MTAAIIRADARRLPLPDESVDLIVSSPPYFAQRSYTDGGKHYRGQIGAEPTPTEYMSALLDCTREWIRVLKPTGSLWINLGDKYSQRVAHRPSSHQDGLFPGRPELAKDWKRDRAAGLARMPRENITDLNTGRYVPEKSLMGLPWRYALGCIDELGLILRAEVVWSKPNGLPESVTDRVGRSHEQWFHLVRQPRYFADVDSIRKPHITPPHTHGRTAMAGRNINLPRSTTGAYHGPNPLGALPRSVWEVATQPLKAPEHLSVDHFAAYPPALIRPIVLGWSPSAICTECGEGRRPVVDKPGLLGSDNNPDRRRRSTINGGRDEWEARIAKPDRIVGHTCACPEPTAATQPAIVLDPFGGTGTTALVADVHGRHGISADRSADYCRLAAWRTTDPTERARALGVPKPPPVPHEQMELL
ncbi:DNA-methyltransferase [Actinomadura decatromicini]|uniref:Methyltransferase n=1 Tax=Actinomadura decatromicini TaxID=2604572 RepID=A0A5D3FGR8_9ACTN|nr:site-specific DNA-methyltransferase [Actinomadura decatromicini]TYK47172.1 hypothetical protein FXF68_25575 [Actinomadura decatromicini]